MTQEQKASAFRALHEGPAFVIPNPWDAGSARVLAALGFEALATTSSGFALTLGRLDGQVTLDEVVEHAGVLDSATELPVSVDLENGFGADPESAARAVTRVAEAGAVGGSIEDWDPDGHLYEPAHAAERVAAASRGRRAPRLSVHAHGPSREPDPRQPRPRRHDWSPAGLRASRGRCPLRARAAQRGRDPRRLRCGLETGQRARPPATGDGRDRRCRSSARQCRGCLGMGRIRGDGRRGRGDPRYRKLRVAPHSGADRGVAGVLTTGLSSGG